MNEKTTKLLQCPFCGSEARFIKCVDANLNFKGWDIGCNGTKVDCIALDGFSGFDSGYSKESITEKWNLRASNLR